MTSFPAFDEINVISDIHMGGGTGFQILAKGERLANLILHLAESPPEKHVALILNGDIIDSLAENIGYIAIEHPEQMVQRIMDDNSFAPVWQALKTFVNTKNRELVIILGNHDLELSLPVVEQHIRNYLVGYEESLEKRNSRNGSITFATHGAGYRCTVGNANVFCTHGNETDPWNKVDFDQLSQLGNALNSGKHVDKNKWIPNGGTRLVVDVMNAVKQNYPFVDLLKPETELVVPLLVVLAPKEIRNVNLEKLLNIRDGKLRGELEVKGLLSADSSDLEAVTDQSATLDIARDSLFGENLRQYVNSGNDIINEDSLLQMAEDAIESEEPLLKPVDTEDTPETLGWGRYLIDRYILRIDKYEALRRAILDWLEEKREKNDKKSKGKKSNKKKQAEKIPLDDTFNITTRDDTFKTIVPRVSDDISFIITGHTHLERAIQIRKDVKQYYYNSGTWIRLMKFSDYVLQNKDEFKKICEDVLEAQSISAIDSAKIKTEPDVKENFVLDRTSMVRIEKTAKGTEGRLIHVLGGENGKAIKLKDVENSKFKR